MVRTWGLCRPLPFGPHIVGLKAEPCGRVVGAGSPSGLAGKLLAARIPSRPGYVHRPRPAGGGQIILELAPLLRRMMPVLVLCCGLPLVAACTTTPTAQNPAFYQPNYDPDAVGHVPYGAPPGRYYGAYGTYGGGTYGSTPHYPELPQNEPQQCGSGYSLIGGACAATTQPPRQAAPAPPEPVDDSCGGWWRLNNLWCHSQ